MDPQDMPQTDWELAEDYYQNQKDMPKLRLEDFMDEDAPKESPSGKISRQHSQRFNKIIEDVHQVLSLARRGKNIQEIAAQLNLDPQYVYDIQMAAQGVREDDEIVVAHLVEMSL